MLTNDWQYLASVGALGPGITRIATLGNNPDIDTGTQPEDVWAGAALGTVNGVDHRLIPRPTSATAMEAVSDSANDAAAGSGARTIVIGYLDSDYTAKTVVVTMNGTTPVPITPTMLRINSVVVVTSGTVGGANAGAIQIRAAGGLGATYAYMQVGVGLARSSMYTVPGGFAYDILSMVLSINRTDTNTRYASYSLCIQNQAGRLIKGIELSNGSEGPYRHEADGCAVNTIAEKSDVWIRCESVSLNDTNTTASLFGIQRPLNMTTLERY